MVSRHRGTTDDSSEAFEPAGEIHYRPLMGVRHAALQPSDYTDPLVYDREVERVLAGSWLPVCRLEQVRDPGDRMAMTLIGRPIVVVRGNDGDLAAFANVCPHRGSTLVDDGPGASTTLVCPYHRWAFRLDGSFVGGPLTGDTDLDDVCLSRIPHSVWKGFVMVNLSGDADDPAVSLAGLAEEITPWRWDELEVVASARFDSTWNWKVMVENWIECYHHIGTHADLLEPVFPARDTRVIDSAGEPWTAMRVGGIEGMEGDPEHWIPGLSAGDARALSVWAAFPLLLAGSVANDAFWLQIEPITATRHSVRMHLLVHRDHVDRMGTDEIAAQMGMLRAVHEEDMVTCSAVQAGLDSGLLERFRLAPLEAPIAEFQHWVHQRMAD